MWLNKALIPAGQPILAVDSLLNVWGENLPCHCPVFDGEGLQYLSIALGKFGHV